ncbi:hypothetical protein AB0A77_28500 [Streptomyces varsoviensis]|uniref:hypothetical protein n=1 Tax=Streptomyces varsoviensis TaxID=67373 RepID=UPI0033CEAF36
MTAPRCGAWLGAKRRYCRATETVRPYRTGLRCPAHTPAAEHGRPEPPPGPGWPVPPLAAAELVDGCAVVSGGQRSPPGVR